MSSKMRRFSRFPGGSPAEEIERLREEKAQLKKQRTSPTHGDSDMRERLESIKRQLRKLHTNSITEREVIDALENLDPV